MISGEYKMLFHQFPVRIMKVWEVILYSTNSQ